MTTNNHEFKDDDANLSEQFLSFIQEQARTLRAEDKPPTALEEWQTQRQSLRDRLISSWGGFPEDRCPLQPRVFGRLKREGYCVEKLVFQTRPGIWMTANLYLPDRGGRHPAVLCVHGHWALAKQQVNVQSRCIGLVKLGFVVLIVDAFGASERGIDREQLGGYHGEMVAAALWPTGLSLAGLQVYENTRAVDYLQSRPEVDPDWIGVTGSSGGGNQSMYVGAIDERLKCVVPVCSVGTYQAYLGVACCMCEMTPAALTFTEEWGVLALVAPRPLMVIGATEEGIAFSVGEAKKSLATARHVFQLYDKKEHLRHTVIESKHEYNEPMRKAMYGWMMLHLKAEGDGSPVPEPPFDTEEPSSLRCFPGNSRPADFVTAPAFAAAEARRILGRRSIPSQCEQWKLEASSMRETLPGVLGGIAKADPIDVEVETDATSGRRSIVLMPEPGITVFADIRPATGVQRGLAILLDLDCGRRAGESELAATLGAGGWEVAAIDLRATGATAWKDDKLYRAPDHNTGQWSVWIGRPLLGQWVQDVLSLLVAYQNHLDGPPQTTAIVGVGPASLIALCTAALSAQIERVATVGGLASYVSDVPYETQRVGIMVPGMLRRVGDIPHLGALISPRRLVIAGGVDGGGDVLSSDDLRKAYACTQAAYALDESADELRILPNSDPGSIHEPLST